MLRTAVLPVLLAILASLTSCTGRHLHALEFQSTPQGGWESTDTLHFTIDTLRRDGNYRLSVCLRTSTPSPYPFSTLVLGVRSQIGTYQRTDTLVCPLAETSATQGEKGVSLRQYTYPLRRLHLHQGQSGTVSVSHLMRRELLEGITDVGIRLED